MFKQIQNQVKKAVAAARTIVPPATPWPVAVKPVDKVYPERISSTPNMGGALNPEGIVLHHSAGSWAGLEGWLQNPKAKASYHTIVNTTGERVVMVPDNRIAWHAGESAFKGKRGCNKYLLGLSVTGDTRNRALTNDEIVSCAQWCIAKMKLHGFGIDDITTHEAITQIRRTNRKVDVSAKAYEQIINAIKERI
jgi:N-acetyl-anhydromuramyl-L-alanine amidase AmpD